MSGESQITNAGLVLRAWRACFGSLARWRVAIAIVSAILVVLGILMVWADYSEYRIAISDVPAPELFNISPWVFVPGLAVVLLILIVDLVCWRDGRSERAVQPARGTEAIEPPDLSPLATRRKLTVYVFLPLSDQTVRGDALLQAAGFKAASVAFEDYVEIKFEDHGNSVQQALAWLRKILDAHLLKDDAVPICIIFTMSTVCCEELAGLCKQEKYLALKDHLSIIFTVAASQKTPHDGECIFRHFVSGKDEVDSIHDYCRVHRLAAGADRAQALFLMMESAYPEQTAGALAQKLFIEDHFSLEKISIAPNKTITCPGNGDTTTIIKKYTEPADVAIVLGYDHALLEAFKALNDAGFEGNLIGGSTLSVRDWQTYLRKKGLVSDKFKVWYTKIKGFEHASERAREFVRFLKEWTHKTLTTPTPNDKRFPSLRLDDPVELEVYRDIEPNYISAFCFDSVRLFALMQEMKKTRLDELDLDSAETHHKMNGPFEEITFIRGRTQVPLTCEQLPPVELG